VLTQGVPATAHLARHLLRCAAWGAAWGAASIVAAPLFLPAVEQGAWLSAGVVAALVLGAAAALYFSTFALFHDAAHGALGLSTRTNDLLLFATSAVLMMSAHGQRQLHLRHHARPLANDDLEGAGALTSLWWAVLVGPWAAFHMRAVSFSVVPAKVRPWVAAENALNVLVTIAAVAWGGVGVWAAVALWWVLQLTMNAWASHIPHRAPRWLLQVASLFAWTGSPVVLSLVYHLEHHAHPRVPCALLRPDLDVHSPLLSTGAKKNGQEWAQLVPAARPRPKTLVPTAPLPPGALGIATDTASPT
jgi:fatty acid desaturase